MTTALQDGGLWTFALVYTCGICLRLARFNLRDRPCSDGQTVPPSTSQGKATHMFEQAF